MATSLKETGQIFLRIVEINRPRIKLGQNPSEFCIYSHFFKVFRWLKGVAKIAIIGS